MTNTTPPKKIFSLLHEIASYLEQLHAALNTEHKALSENNITDIQTIAQEKIILMEHLEDLDKERRLVLEKAGLNLSATGIEDYFQQSSSTSAPELKSLWETIAHLSKQCEQQNDVNGIIIESNRRHTENALSILQGKQQNTELYTSKGKSVKASGKQTLIRA